MSELTPQNKNETDSLQALLDRIHQNPDFPTFSRMVQEINLLASDADQRSANDLANIILRDFSLTQKILKLVNSAQFRHFGGTIHTVSRAVVILGFEEIRQIALTLMLFDHFKPDRGQQRLQQSMLQALFSALLAQTIAPRLGVRKEEEVFLSALFMDLGRIVLLRHAPEKMDEIEALCTSEKISEESASQRCIGATLPRLGLVLAQGWNLPDPVLHSMQPPIGPKNITRLDANSRGSAIARLSHTIASNLSTLPPAEANRLMLEEARQLGIDGNLLFESVEKAKEKIRVYTRILPPVVQNLPLLKQLSGLDNAPAAQETPAEPAVPTPASHAELIIQCIEDITQALLGEFDLNPILMTVLETLYRGLSATQAMLFIMDRQGKQLKARFGFGEAPPDVLRSLTVDISVDNPFARALLRQQDYLLSLDDPALQPHQNWQFQDGKSDQAAFYPIIVNGRPLGLFYLEGPHRIFTPTALNAIKMLRNQTILAIRQKHGG